MRRKYFEQKKDLWRTWESGTLDEKVDFGKFRRGNPS